jgi:hypothetical protein
MSDENISWLDYELKHITRIGLRDEYEERAAILEFDGGMKREDAEKKAAVEIQLRTLNRRGMK